MRLCRGLGRGLDRISGRTGRVAAGHDPGHLRLPPELPLSANGKIDRKALPEPEVAHTAAGTDHVAAANATEVPVEIWEEVLGLSGIGTAHDFFPGWALLSAIRADPRAAASRSTSPARLPTTPRWPVWPPWSSGCWAPESGRPWPRQTTRAALLRPERLWFLDRLGGRTLLAQRICCLEGSSTAALRWSTGRAALPPRKPPDHVPRGG
nr:hypothetical protein [uncultured bacterium]